MKKLITILFLLSSLGWTSVHAEYDPDNYFYGRAGLGSNLASDWDIHDGDIGSSLGIGYVTRLTDWNLFGSIRAEYFNQSVSRVIHNDEDGYLRHLGVAAEWRFSIGEYNPDSYFYTHFTLGSNEGSGWDNANATGSGIGAGYTRLLVKKLNIFGSLRYEHFSQVEAGEPFNDDDESHLDHLGVIAEWRF